MNEPKAIEIGFAKALRCREVPGGIRTWQSLNADFAWSGQKDRAYPLTSIKASTPQDDGQSMVTFVVDVEIEPRTRAEEDQNHQAISALYGQIKAACDALFIQSRATTGTELTAFTNAITAELAGEASNFSFSGFTFGAAGQPYEDDGDLAMPLVMRVHYSRSDF
jgi:hypothetical protein